MIKLEEKNLFCEGGNRKVYYYANKTKLIKITKPDALENRRKKANFFKRLRPIKYFSENREDYKFYSKQKSKVDFIPKFYGFIRTNLGYGTVSENILNYDKTQAMSLENFLKENINKDNFFTEINIKLKAAFLTLYKKMIDKNFICRELKDFNLVVRENKDKSYKIYIIDGFGNSEFIPISEHIKFFGVNKIVRQLMRFNNFEIKKWGEYSKQHKNS